MMSMNARRAQKARQDERKDLLAPVLQMMQNYQDMTGTPMFPPTPRQMVIFLRYARAGNRAWGLFSTSMQKHLTSVQKAALRGRGHSSVMQLLEKVSQNFT